MASSAQQYQHPLPQAPQHSQPPPPPHHRQQSYGDPASPSKSRTFSIHSDKSRRSSGAKPNFTESHDEKEARRLHSKADPTLAMNEAEPSAVAAMRTQSVYGSIRAIQHKDPWGNPIADPDLSNPTRNRWERPLDTIRSFEAAVDGGYMRKSMIRADTDPVANWNRRSSFQPQPRPPPSNYYNSRPPSQLGLGTPSARNSYFGGPGYGGGQGYNDGYDGGHSQAMPRQRMSRMQTEPHYQNYGREQQQQQQQQNYYPYANKDRSYETVTSAAASGNSDHAGYQTDPTSSDNSSIDRRSPAKRPEPVNDYGIGFSQSSSYQAPNFALSSNGNGNGMNHPLPTPPNDMNQQIPRQAIPRKQPGSTLKRPAMQMQQEPEKRKSWLARRFSKNN